MRRLAIALIAAAALLAVAPGAASADSHDTGSTTVVVPTTDDPSVPVDDTRVVDVVEASGLLDPVLVDFIQGSVLDADEAGSEAIIVQLNVGGTVVSSDRLAEMVDAIDDVAVPVAIWIGPPGAKSGEGLAPLLAVADVVGVSPGSHVVVPVGTSVVGDGPARSEQRLGSEDALEEGWADLASPTLGEFLVDLDGLDVDGRILETATVIDEGDGPRRQPNVRPRFAKLGLGSNLLHTVASPSIAFLLAMAAIALLLFELFTGGVGVAGVTGAGCLVLSSYGLAVLPTRSWAVGLLLLAAFALGVDIQTGVPRFWTWVGSAAALVGSLFLFDGVSMSWLALVAGLGGLAAMAIGATPAVVRSRYGTPTIGREWMIGEEVDVVSDIDPEGVIELRSARWRARTNRATPISAGERARVAGLEGVIVEVEPLEGAARDYRERRSTPAQQ